jgi:membrane-associated phospholipid phosphatase
MIQRFDGGQASIRTRSRLSSWLAEHRRPVQLVLGAMWVAGLVYFSATQGLVQARDWVFVFLLTGLLIFSIGDFDRWAKGVLLDWVPFAAILFAYDWLRGVTDTLNLHVHTAFAIKADQALFGTPIPSVYLQHRYYHPPNAYWYDYAAFGIYLTHFFATLVVAAILWKYAYPMFKRWRNLVVVLATAGLATYVIFPAAPPWLASEQGHIGSVVKVISQLYQHTHIHVARAAFEHNQDFVNPTAAIPSLHAAFPLLMLLLLWSTGKWWLRILLTAYTLLMGLTLVYTGEHYVIDIFLGWAYAIGTFIVVTYAERWWARRRERLATAAEAAAPAGAVVGVAGNGGAPSPRPVSYTVSRERGGDPDPAAS